MSNRAEELVNGVSQLVSLPTIYFEVKRVIESPNSSLSDLANTISLDPALAAKLLRIVNSPFYAQSRLVETITRAVSMLGTNQIHDLTLAASLASTFARIPPSKMDVARFWHGSVFRAEAVKTLAIECGLRDKERFFVQGLLSDIGHMVMYLKVPEQAIEALHAAENGQASLNIAEQRALGYDYAEVGGALLRAWGLPSPIHVPITHHMNPEVGAPHAMETALLNIAASMAWSEEHAVPPDSQVVPAAWTISGLSPDILPLLMDESRERAQQMTEILNGFMAKAA